MPENQQAEGVKTFSLKKLAGVFNAPVKVLDGALAAYRPSSPDVHGAAIDEGRPLGWVRGALPAPFHEDRYIVEFLDGEEVAVLAYLDRFGRAFTMDEPTVAPPARHPDLMMVRVEDESTDEQECGCFFACDDDDGKRVVARYRLRDGAYSIYDSWYDFGDAGVDLTYEDAMTRVYLACIYRPTLTGITVPTSGLACIDDLLDAGNVVRGLRAVKLLISRAASDPALKPPTLALRFNDWLDEAGFTDRTSHSWLVGYKGEDENGPLRLVRTRRYADTYYLAVEEGAEGIDSHTVWAVESALNRYLLIKEAFGIRAPLVDDSEIAREDAHIRTTIALQAPRAGKPADADMPEAAGEWDVRYFHGLALENLRLPYRIEAQFHVDVEAPGVAAWSVTVPDAALMPSRRYDDDDRAWVEVPHAERSAQARRYAMHVGIALAAASFASTRDIETAMVSARPLDADDSEAASPRYQVTFVRGPFCEKEAYRLAAAGDPAAFLRSFEGFLEGDADYAPPFEPIVERPSYEMRARSPELVGGSLTYAQQTALGAASADGLRISYDVDLHFEGERLSEELACATSTQDAISMVLKTRDATGNPLVYEACNRLMTCLTKGDFDAHDALAVRGCFAGDDPYAEAISRARAVVKTDPEEAVDILKRVVEEAASSGRYVDTGEVIHRSFESYPSRLVYNLHTLEPDKKVELLPPSLLMCYLELVNLLDESFTRSDEAVALSHRLIEIAPTFSVAYRRCARAHMLIGDLENAARLLLECLSIATEPDEIAMAYYQLAYVEWKAGRPLSGLGCYLKSIMTSAVYARQCSIELHELMAEEGLDVIPRDDVDMVLEESGIPVAPTPLIIDNLEEAMKAAVDANLFAPARAFLGTVLMFAPDDALTDVLRSLGDPRIETAADA